MERHGAVGAVMGTPDAVAIPETTLPEFVLGQAHRRGDRRALIDAHTGRELTYSELASTVVEVASGLAARGVRVHDVLAVCAPNSIEFAVVWYAASSVGATVTPVNPLSTGEEIARQLRRTGARWLVTTADLFNERVGAAAHACGIHETFLIGATDEGAPGTVPFEALSRDGHVEAPVVDVDPDDIALLPSSSGTTGPPKSVVLTHRNLVANLCQLRPVDRITEDDVVIAATPMCHILGLQATLDLGLSQGATVVILPRYELRSFLRAIQDFGVTRAEVVPPIILALATSDVVEEYDLSRLRLLTSAAAPLAVTPARACARRIGCRVRQGYGLTELAGATHCAPDDGPDRPDSVGPPLPGVECRVVDPDTGTDLGMGHPGELLVRSAAAMRGYLDDPTASAAMIDADGWVHTGDIVTVDGDGWFRVTDRIKELIKYKGYQVAPTEIEDVLLAHPSVADAAVVPSPDALAGEVPKAFVVLRAAASLDELTAWVAARVAPYSRVRRMEFVDRIPRSSAGKILRRMLVERERDARAEDLTGTVVLVTGGGRGLGRVLALTLAGAGAAVGLLGRSSQELAATVAEIQSAGGIAAAASADVTDLHATEVALAELRRRLGPVEVLVNNAGVGGPIGPMWEADPAEWWRTLEINLGGAFAITRMVLPEMIAAGHGRVVNITSNAGVYRWPLMSAYATSKAALVKLTETLAAETRRHRVAVFSVDPGLLPLGLGAVALETSPDPATPEGHVVRWVRGRLASGHGADPQRAARLVAALAGGRGDRLSGRHLTVADDLDTLVGRIEQIEREDLYTLRLRTGRLASGLGDIVPGLPAPAPTDASA